MALVCLFFKQTTFAGELLPDIDARRFNSSPIQKSKTGRVYLFSAEPNQLPNAGAILLVHDQDKPILAFRVIRADPARSEYVAKKIRRYDQAGELQLDKKYLMMEKVADVIAAPITENPEAIATRTAPISTAGIAPSNDDTQVGALDEPPPAEARVPPAPSDPDQRLSAETYDSGLDDSDEHSLYPHEVEETQTLNPFDHSLGAMLGVYRNLSNFNTSGTNNSGFNLNFAQVIARDVFVLAKAPQDALNLEFGLGYYSIQNIEPFNDSYTIMPLVAQARYDLHFSSSFSLLFYAGFQYNWMVSNTNGQEDFASTIQGVQATVGLGMLYMLGPHWYLRVDAGWDKVAAGLTLQW